jgi:secreted PhoX family phosphatase
MRRRDFLASATGAILLGPAFLREALATPASAGPGPYGPLQAANADGLMLPAGFTGRRIAQGGEIVGGYPWHFASDGQATYATSDGGYVLVSNSEAPGVLGGGSSAIRFTKDGEIDRAYRILAGTNLNCGGGPTPWGTWLSGEEHPGGMIWEADPAGVLPQMPRPALGNFSHEAAAVDPVGKHVYETEDQGDGCFYRFTPDAYPDLSSGVLEVAVVGAGGAVTWKEVPDPNVLTAGAETRNQVPDATRFDGGEGIWYDEGVIYFTTKGDRKVWAYDTRTSVLEVIYDRAATPGSALDAVDNVTVSASGDVYVCEDGGNMEVGIITPGPDRVVAPFCRLTGADHEASEMVGVIFDPSGTRMYFGSQRAFPFPGATGTPGARGAIYEVTGPFRLPAGGVPPSKVYGPPAGEGALGGLPDAADVDGLRIEATRGGVRVHLREAATVRAALRTGELKNVKFDRWAEPRPVLTTLGRTTARLPRGTHALALGVTNVPAIITVEARTASGQRRVAAARVG